jgi:hypothetical protein
MTPDDLIVVFFATSIVFVFLVLVIVYDFDILERVFPIVLVFVVNLACVVVVATQLLAS